MSPEEYLEGFWDCDACSSIGLSGLKDQCPNCGQRRPSNVRFYLKPGSRKLSQSAELAHAKAGPDWRCSFCSYLNRANWSACRGCGAPRNKDSKQRQKGSYVPTEQHFNAGSDYSRRRASTASSRASQSRNHVAFRPKRQTDSKDQPKLSRVPVKAVIVAILAIILLGLSSFGIYSQFIQTHPIEATVSGYSWERQVMVEVYGEVREEGWSLPRSARLVSTSNQIHHYDTVFSHNETKTRQVPHTTYEQVPYSCTSDLGNGTFHSSTCYRQESRTTYTTETYTEPVYKQVPVYQPYYTYDIDKWHYDRTEKTSGLDHQPYWPKVEKTDTQREGRKTQKYTAFFLDDQGKQYHKELEFEEWQDLSLHQPVLLHINRQDAVRQYQLLND